MKTALLKPQALPYPGFVVTGNQRGCGFGAVLRAGMKELLAPDIAASFSFTSSVALEVTKGKKKWLFCTLLWTIGQMRMQPHRAMADLAGALANLPDGVKRLILLHAQQKQAEASESHSEQAMAALAGPDQVSRSFALPKLQRGIAVLDGVLTPEQLQVRARSGSMRAEVSQRDTLDFARLCS